MKFARGLIAFLVLGFLAGCGGSSGRIPVSGKVTVNGQPVPVGAVMIIPAAGTQGAAGSTAIENGEYSFDSETGPQPGKYTLVINLQDAVSPGKGAVQSRKPGGDSKSSGPGLNLPGGQVEFRYEIDVPADGEVVKDVEIK